MDPNHRRRIDMLESLSAVYLLALFLLSILVAGVGGHKLFLVLVGFFPTILTIIISLVIYEEYVNRKKTLWLIPIVIVAAFYVLGSGNLPLFDEFNMGILTGLNFLLAMLYVMMIFGVLRKPYNRPQKQETPAQRKKEREPQTIEEYVNSIEDKSKAINFAIGRVYSKHYGGTKEMREKIRVPPEWYNEFSSIGVDTDVVDYTQLSEILKSFEQHFTVFEKTESQLFGRSIHRLHDLIRDPKGKDRVIDVIEHNDRDPVKAYFEGTKDFCKRLRAELGRRELSLVKNEYKGTDEDEEDGKGAQESSSAGDKVSSKKTAKESPAKKSAAKSAEKGSVNVRDRSDNTSTDSSFRNHP